MQRKRRRIQDELSSFSFRIIQQIVNDNQQSVAGALEQAEIFPLFSNGLGGQSQFGHAQNAIHWGTNLMAHIGQEGALGAVRRFCGFASFVELSIERPQLARAGFHLFFQFDFLAQDAHHAPLPCHQAKEGQSRHYSQAEPNGVPERRRNYKRHPG